MPICKSDYFDVYISSRGTKIDKYRSMFSRAVPLYGIFVVVNLQAACFKGNATVASLRDLKHWWVTPLFIWILNSSVKYSLSVQRLDKATSVDKQDIYYSTLENLFFKEWNSEGILSPQLLFWKGRYNRCHCMLNIFCWQQFVDGTCSDPWVFIPPYVTSVLRM